MLVVNLPDIRVQLRVGLDSPASHPDFTSSCPPELAIRDTLAGLRNRPALRAGEHLARRRKDITRTTARDDRRIRYRTIKENVSFWTAFG